MALIHERYIHMPEMTEEMNGSEQTNVAVSTEQTLAVNTETSTSAATAGSEVTDVQKIPNGESQTNGGCGKEPKKDGPWGKTDLEKAQYSFYKQLNKQRSKYERQIAQMADRLERLENPDKYRPKTRADFPVEKGGDDEYINYLVNEKVKTLFNSQIEAWKKEQEEEESRRAADEEYRAQTDENIKKLYPTPEAEKDFRDTVREAMNRGLGKFLDADPDLANYILTSPTGPAMMYKLATSKDAVEKLFKGSRGPMDLQFRIRDLEREVQDELRAKSAQAPQALPTITETATPQQKPIGKPGIKGDSESRFLDRDTLLRMSRD